MQIVGPSTRLSVTQLYFSLIYYWASRQLPFFLTFPLPPPPPPLSAEDSSEDSSTVKIINNQNSLPHRGYIEDIKKSVQIDEAMQFKSKNDSFF